MTELLKNGRSTVRPAPEPLPIGGLHQAMLALARGPVGIEGAYQCVTDQQELDVAPPSEVIIALYHLRLRACAIIEVLTYGRHSSEPSIWPWLSD